MSERIRLVRGDSRPPTVVNIKSRDATPMDCTGATPRMYFRREGTTAPVTTLVGTLLVGFRDANDDLITSAPYDVAGAGGRISFAWGSALAGIEPGNYEGEIELTFPDTTVQTVYDVVKFRVRADFS